MKEHIKRFDSASAANNYAITAIPFITTILGPNSPTDDQNLACDESGKKLVNVSGVIEIQTAGPEMVDLGLASGTLWAAYNLGAESGNAKESYYGHYYMWGDPEPADDRVCEWSNYKFGSGLPLSKYDTDGKTVLEAVDDPATVAYGANYHSPTIAQIEELLTLSNTYVTDYNGISGLNGRVFTGTNGNILFVPFSGQRIESDFNGVGSFCCLWSNLLNEDHSLANCVTLSSSGSGLSDNHRRTGFSVRPVYSVNP